MRDRPCAECRNCDEFCLKKIDFIDGLPADKQMRIMEKTLHEKHKRGSVLFRETEPVDAIFIIRQGKVKLCTSDAEGREQIVGIFSDRDTIWEGIFMDQSRYPYSAVCVSPVTLCRIRRSDFEEIIQDGAIAMKVIGLLSRKLHDANERNMLLATSDPKARLAGFLLYRLKRAAGDAVTLKLEDIAASISLRPETVSRKVKELERDGVITRRGQSTIQVTDIVGLEQLFQKAGAASSR